MIFLIPVGFCIMFFADWGMRWLSPHDFYRWPGAVLGFVYAFGYAAIVSGAFFSLRAVLLLCGGES